MPTTCIYNATVISDLILMKICPFGLLAYVQHIILNRKSCEADDHVWNVNYLPMGPDHPLIKDEWQKQDTPYDYNSIMQVFY